MALFQLRRLSTTQINVFFFTWIRLSTTQIMTLFHLKKTFYHTNYFFFHLKTPSTTQLWLYITLRRFSTTQLVPSFGLKKTSHHTNCGYFDLKKTFHQKYFGFLSPEENFTPLKLRPFFALKDYPPHNYGFLSPEEDFPSQK